MSKVYKLTGKISKKDLETFKKQYSGHFKKDNPSF